MKSKSTVSTKKQSVAVKDLKARKNPKGGGVSVDSSAESKQSHHYIGTVTLVK